METRRLEDARLIAAAPDLLAALKTIVQYYKDGDTDRVIFSIQGYVLPAIARATGKEPT